jgi:hypothetical protein
MVEYELRMLKSALKLNVKKPSYLFSCAASFIACFFIGYSLALAPEYLLLGNYPQVLAESEAIVCDILTTLFSLLLLCTVLGSLFNQGVGSYLGQVDTKILASTPIDSRSIITAKCIRSLVSRLSLIIFAALVVLPISLRLSSLPILVAAALVTLTLYIEFLQATSYAVHSMRELLRSRLSPRLKRFMKILTVTLSAIVLLIIVLNVYHTFGPCTAVFTEGALALWNHMPSALTASLILEFMVGRADGTLFSLLSLSGFLIGALAFTYLASGSYYPENLPPRAFPRDRLDPLRSQIGRFLNRLSKWEKPSHMVFLKDIQLTLRGALVDFSLLDFTLMYAVSLAAWYLLEAFLPFQPIPELEARLGFVKVFVREFVIFLAVLPFITSLSSFSRESWKLWLLKAFPFKDRAIAHGKFLFALTISAASLAPMVLVTGLVFEITPSEWMIAVTLPLILLIANSAGVLVGAYLPPYGLSNQMSIKSMSIFFIFLAIALTPFTLIPSARSNVMQVLLLALLTVYSIGSTIFFLRQAGKGFRKLELRKILPHRAYSLEREPEERAKALTDMHPTEEITITSTVHFKQGQPIILINFTIVNESNENVVVDSLLYEIRVSAVGHPFDSHRKKRIFFLKKAGIQAGAMHEISEDLIMPPQTYEQLSTLSSQYDSDIAWKMTAVAFLESAKGLAQIRSEKEQITAYDHWRKWCNSWAKKETSAPIR